MHKAYRPHKKINLKIWAFAPTAYKGLAFYIASLVCWYTRSKWNHIGFSFNKDYYEADLYKGIQKLDSIPPDAQLIYCDKIEFNTYCEVTDWIKTQMGKKYNLLAMFGFGTMKDADDPQKTWFCSEFAAEVIKRCHITALGNVNAWKVYPGKLVKCLCDY